MRGRFAGIWLLVGAAVWSAGAAALGMAVREPERRCEVVNASKLPEASGGPQAICREVERAIAAAAPTARYSASINVMSSSRLSAVLIVNGRTLPDQNFAVMDRELSPSTIRRFAEALGIEVEKAAKE